MGYLDCSNVLVLETVRYCFMHILRDEFNELAVRWNTHIISRSKHSNLPRGRPDSMYFLPNLFNATDQKQELDLNEIKEFEDPAFVQCSKDNKDDFIEFAETVLCMKGYEKKPKTVAEALETYFVLLEAIDKYL